MIRVVKDPEERRNELINIAEELFSKNGYDQTAVSDIVKKANVAQGLFYYYFKSKDEILNAIIVRFIDEAKDLMNGIVNNNTNAVQKIFSTYKNLKKFRKKREGLVNYIHEEKNEILHFRLENQISPIITQGLTKIIQQGVDENLFNTKYPKEAAISILTTEFAIFHEMHKTKDSKKGKEQYILAIIDLMERILGAKQGIFNDFLKLV